MSIYNFWENTLTIDSIKYKCGYCNNQISSNKGYRARDYSKYEIGYIYICHFCGFPTFINEKKEQFPGPIIGDSVQFIPEDKVNNLYNEARRCYSVNAFTSVVMCCRKLLMNIAVHEGAPENQNYINYVNYLETENYIPPNGRDWVDSIRKLGNEANHEIEMKTAKEAEKILKFTEMLLRFIYEMPGLMKESEE